MVMNKGLAWYTRVSRAWDSADRQGNAEFYNIVAFLKLFLDTSFVLDSKAENDKDQVLNTG
ncbi:hypothetical protein PHPALM_30697 [Phytophthora palmivora]|uniref:Uncharacterized protein n=1 Tax=Phytophthora palmivora TaxID=4796 RepID=A0A2P4X4H3_9STRA|nr:hypothetical protein PHPALM_30697 [Phytophthora palmivora]